MQTVLSFNNSTLNFILLDSLTVLAYQHLTYPLWRKQLSEIDGTSSIIAVGAEFNALPVGLAIAYRFPEGNKAQILSIFVQPEYRRRGIGKRLLENLSQRLSAKGCDRLELSYTSKTESTSALEKLLNRQSWSIPQPKMLVCHSNQDTISKAPWLYSSRLPATFEVFPLSKLTVREYQIIQQKQARSPWYPEILSPFKGELPVEPLNSLGLRYRGEVVGWMATHRIDPQTIRYTSLFVRKDLQRMGRAIPLIAEAIKRQLQTDIPNYICTAAVENKPMVKFVRRRLQPFLTQIQESKQTHLEIARRSL